MTSPSHYKLTVALLATAGLILARPATGQDGAGTTGAAVLQIPAGSRAAALSGAYTAATGDADVVFYNPAGIAGLSAAAALSYQRHVEDIGVGTAAVAYRLGRIVVGLGFAFVDVGDVPECVPDPAFGGQTCQLTGNSVSASETTGRVAAALSLMQDRLQLGAGVGLISVDLVDVTRRTALFDVGAQYALRAVTIGASLRNAGGALRGNDLADAPLPTEARLGATVNLTRPSGLGATAAADLIAALGEGGAGIAVGIEAGLLPAGTGQLGAVGRFGYNGTAGDGGLGALQLGAGVSIGNFAVDYVYQNYDLLGSLHRFGVRWARLP